MGRRCAAGADCCSGACDPASTRCVCPDGADECGGDCVAIEQYQTDVDNCGGCRNRCRKAPECQLPACIEGACDSTPDPARVGQPCGHDGGVCGADGTCACPPERPTACRRGCVDTGSDPDNCGACDNRCPKKSHGTATCTGGVCGIACNDGYNPCGDGCCADGRDCCNGDCCGPNQCCTVDGCKQCGCTIGADFFDANVINPHNACQFCDPTRNRFDWSLLRDGTFCGEDRTCCNGECCSPTECCDGVQCTDVNCPNQCEIQNQPFRDEQRNPANDCQICDPDQNRFDWTNLSDQTTCGGVPGRVCCNVQCCSPTECCGATSCEECGPHCRIGNADIPEKTVNPADPCEVCKPEANFNDWTTADDDTSCGSGRVCCHGECCPLGLCCTDGACGECHCKIGDDEFKRGDVNQFNHCQICNLDLSRDDWSPGPPNESCGGLFNDRFCCAGDCCPADQCCNAIGECETCGCVISSEPVQADAVNQLDTCQVCKPNKDRRNWTVLGDGEACGTDADDRVCCSGGCCPQGQCCVDGECKDCGCQIGDGDPIAAGTPNPDNVCEVCDPSRSRLDWSPVKGDVACGTDGTGRCCAGDCCPGDQCCLLDACGECLCHIGDDNVAPETPNPDNDCQVCDPHKDPFDWTILADKEPCAEHPDQICCGGKCCEPGQCCTDGACQACACTIGDKGFDKDAVNPDNPCEKCDPSQSTTDWTPLDDDTPCGDHQVCCAGKCCGVGECCTEIGTCLKCRCIIDGQTVEAGVSNPANGCEVCDPLVSTTDWSPAVDESPCADQFGRVCCVGHCCSQGECCAGGVCGPCGCLIDGHPFAPGDVNPENDCEVCDPTVSVTDWSAPSESTRCEHSEGRCCGRECCFATCCPGDVCCADDTNCGTCGGDSCTIAGTTVPDGTINPANDCETCKPFVSNISWTVQFDGTPCGPIGAQFCCNDVCCESGACCNADGVCEIGGNSDCENGCTIGGQFFPLGFLNPDNPCEQCFPSLSTSDWSPVDNRVKCGDGLQQACCDGVCCPSGACCSAPVVGGICGPCP